MHVIAQTELTLCKFVHFHSAQSTNNFIGNKCFHNKEATMGNNKWRHFELHFCSKCSLLCKWCPNVHHIAKNWCNKSSLAFSLFWEIEHELTPYFDHGLKDCAIQKHWECFVIHLIVACGVWDVVFHPPWWSITGKPRLKKQQELWNRVKWWNKTLQCVYRVRASVCAVSFMLHLQCVLKLALPGPLPSDFFRFVDFSSFQIELSNVSAIWQGLSSIYKTLPLAAWYNDKTQ